MQVDRKSINGHSRCGELQVTQWDVIVVRAVHKLKNYESKLSCTLRNEDRAQFVENFEDLKSAVQLEMLHECLEPYLLLREKEYVEKSAPPKEELIIDVELTVPQKQYYRAIYEQYTAFLYKRNAKDGPRQTNLSMELREWCNHPHLVKGAETEIAKILWEVALERLW